MKLTINFMLYSKKEAKFYMQEFSQTDKRDCKKRIARLLIINGTERSNETIGQWFKNPECLNNSNILETITLPTMLYSMKISFDITNFQKQKNEAIQLLNFFD